MVVLQATIILLGLTASVVTIPGPTGDCDSMSVMAQLLEWRWTDVARECRQVLAPTGYCAVQVSPPSEHVMATSARGSWEERYQPVSYHLHSRSGSHDEFHDMVLECWSVGVRVVAEVVLNNMAPIGWKGQGIAGSVYDASWLSFPAVPYEEADFNDVSYCDQNQTLYNETEKIRNCPLEHLLDLDQTRDHVRARLTDYLDGLVDLDVTGFAVQSAAYMWPQDLQAILNSVKNLTDGSRPFIALEVEGFTSSEVHPREYQHLGHVTEPRFSQNVAKALDNFHNFNQIVDYSSGMIESDRAVVFVDSPSTQRYAPDTLTFRRPREYVMATALTLAYGYGLVRVKSGFEFTEIHQGPPVTEDGSIRSVYTDREGWCADGWVCEHRWDITSDMVTFHKVVNTRDVNHVTITQSLLAFSRGTIGFFALFSQIPYPGSIPTGLAAGQYCDLLSHCAHKVTVDTQGIARLNRTHTDLSILALLNLQAPELTYKRTTILLRWETRHGDYVFFRGGLDHNNFARCSQRAEANNTCAIPIHARQPFAMVTSHTSAYTFWSQGDRFLDWYGREKDQGAYGHFAAQGSPGLWTTNDTQSAAYSDLNKEGPHFWLLDVDMDCSRTDAGKFEIRAYLVAGSTGFWDQCNSGKNFQAYCGQTNVFYRRGC